MATPPVFTAGSVLTAAQMNAAGLWLVRDVTISAQSTVDIKQVFTSDYDFYKITGYFSSASSYLRMNLIDGATPTVRNAPSYYTAGFQIAAIIGTLSAAIDNAQTYGSIFSQSMGDGTQFTMELSYRPATKTAWSSFGTSIGNASTEHRSGAYHVAIAADGIRLTSGANMTGTVRVYGYRKS